MGNFPRWAYWVLGIVLVLAVCAVFKFNFSIGSSGIHATQDLIK